MFDYRKPLVPLNGKVIPGRELYRKLGEICIENYRSLPVTFTAEDYLVMARQNDWIRETNGGFKVVVEPMDDMPKAG